jgi:hypothetical protein
MNPISVGSWIGDWAWSLPLIVLTVVIHVWGLALIGGKFVAVFGDSLDNHSFMPKFAVVIGGTALLAILLHGIETGIWAVAYRFSGRHTRHALFAECDDNLRPREPISQRSLAVDGRLGGTQRDVALRADYGLSVRHDPKGPAAREQRTAS